MAVPNNIDANDPLVLDRLVDGELTDAEERTVIAQLSQTPDGWRRCALAFLEARCWQRAARHVQELSDPQHNLALPPLDEPPLDEAPLDEAPLDETPLDETRPSRIANKRNTVSRFRLSIHWPGALALCALFLLAFGVGTLLPSPWNRSAQPARPSGAVPLVDSAAQPKAPVHLVAQDQPVNSEDLLLGNVTFVDNSGSQFDVPVYDWNEQFAEELMFGSQNLSPEFLQQLKRHQVRSHQSYVPVRLKDGRRVVVPVQKLEIVPVGGTAYYIGLHDPGRVKNKVGEILFPCHLARFYFGV